jgi:hypothetical protein
MSNAKTYERVARALILAFVGVAGGVSADAAPDYRLAGIVAVGSDRLLAVIEMPDGRQGLFRSGDALGEGRIRDITRSDVRVEINGQDLLLSLRGNPKLSAAVPVVETYEDEPFVEAPPEDVTTRNQPLFYADTVRLLTSARGGAGGSQVAGEPAAAAGPADAATAEALSTRLNELLGVPSGARIIGVNGVLTGSPQEVIDKIVPLLGEARPVRLDISGAGDVQTILITPVDESPIQ